MWHPLIPAITTPCQETGARNIAETTGSSAALNRSKKLLGPKCQLPVPKQMLEVVAGDQHHELTIECKHLLNFQRRGYGLQFLVVLGNAQLVHEDHHRSSGDEPSQTLPETFHSSAVISMHQFHSKTFFCGDCSLVKCHAWLWSSLIHCSMCLPEMSTAANIRCLLPVCLANVKIYDISMYRYTSPVCTYEKTYIYICTQLVPMCPWSNVGMLGMVSPLLLLMQWWPSR